MIHVASPVSLPSLKIAYVEQDFGWSLTRSEIEMVLEAWSDPDARTGGPVGACV